METRFGWAQRGSRGRSGSVNGTRGVDSQKAVPVIHKSAFPILCRLNQLRPYCRPQGGRSGRSELDGRAPPFCCPQRARGCCAIHICATPPGGVAPVLLKMPRSARPSRELDSNCNGHSRLETSVRARRKPLSCTCSPIVPCAFPDRNETPIFSGQNQPPANELPANCDSRRRPRRPSGLLPTVTTRWLVSARPSPRHKCPLRPYPPLARLQIWGTEGFARVRLIANTSVHSGIVSIHTGQRA